MPSQGEGRELRERDLTAAGFGLRCHEIKASSARVLAERLANVNDSPTEIHGIPGKPRELAVPEPVADGQREERLHRVIPDGIEQSLDLYVLENHPLARLHLGRG